MRGREMIILIGVCLVPGLAACGSGSGPRDSSVDEAGHDLAGEDTGSGDVADEDTVGGDVTGEDVGHDDVGEDLDVGEEPGALPDPAAFRTTDHAHEVCGPTPDEDCTPADMDWMGAEHGSTVTRADVSGVALYRLVAFVEREGPSNIDVLVVGPDAAPLEGIEVAFYYSTAPETSRPDEWYPVKVTGVTEADGIVGFAIGGGAYYGCGEGGPHAIWVSEPGTGADTTVPSDLADHLGMLVGTNHRHLDIIFQRVDPPPSVPGDGVRCPLS